VVSDTEIEIAVSGTETEIAASGIETEIAASGIETEIAASSIETEIAAARGAGEHLSYGGGARRRAVTAIGGNGTTGSSRTWSLSAELL